LSSHSYDESQSKSIIKEQDDKNLVHQEIAPDIWIQKKRETLEEA